MKQPVTLATVRLLRAEAELASTLHAMHDLYAITFELWVQASDQRDLPLVRGLDTVFQYLFDKILKAGGEIAYRGRSADKLDLEVVPCGADLIDDGLHDLAFPALGPNTPEEMVLMRQAFSQAIASVRTMETEAHLIVRGRVFGTQTLGEVGNLIGKSKERTRRLQCKAESVMRDAILKVYKETT